MDNLINYGSDEDNGDSDNSSKYHQGMMEPRRVPHGVYGDYNRPSKQQRGTTQSRADDGTNYDQVQMDLSEEDEPPKNSVIQKPHLSPDRSRDRPNRSQNRVSSHCDTNKQRDGRDNRRSNERDRDQRDKSRDRDQRDRSSCKNSKDDEKDRERDRSYNRDSRDDRSDKYDRDRASSRGGGGRDYRGGGDRDKRGNGYDRDRDNGRRDNKDSNRDSRDKLDNRRDRDDKKDLDNHNNRDSRDNKDRGDRDNKQRDSRRRSPIYQHSNNYNKFRGGGGNKRFDRASNKLAQLEKLGIEIKTPENFVPPTSGIYTPDDARGNNGPYLGLSGNQMGATGSSGGGNSMGGDGQFFMPGVTGRFRDQIERRKQLWAKSKQPDQTPAQPAPVAPAHTPRPSATVAAAAQPTGTATWAATTFAQDTDGRQANKFKRLMGIRGEGSGSSASAGGGPSTEGGSAPNKRQEEMFTSMEAQYEVARTATHTMRGVGLGFSSAGQGLYQR